jgi:hypothetical protein
MSGLLEADAEIAIGEGPDIDDRSSAFGTRKKAIAK